MRTGVVLLIKPNSEIPSRFAHVRPRQDIDEIDMTPCRCGARFYEHDWLLTVETEITVLACSLGRPGPQTWNQPVPPPAVVRAVRTVHDTLFLRDPRNEVWTSAARTDGAKGGFMLSWYELLNYAPLVDATDELDN